MIDHHHLGVHGPAPGHHQMAVVVIGAVATEAVVIGAGDVGEDLGVLLQPRNVSHIAVVGGGGPGLHLDQIAEDLGLLQVGFAQEAVHPLDAEIVAAPLEQGHRRGVGERACDGGEVPVEELLLQVLGASAYHHPLAGLQRRHQVGVSLAGAGARLYQQAAATLDGARHRFGHLQLRRTGLEALDVAGQRAIWLEQGLDGQRSVPRKSGHYAKSAAKAGLIMRSDEEIDLMVRIRLVIIILHLWLITLGRRVPLLVLLGAATIVGANLAQLMFLADLGHLPLDVVGARGRRRARQDGE
ncbi:hypothetical protein D3C76_865780 [compost metagenome]